MTLIYFYKGGCFKKSYLHWTNRLPLICCSVLEVSLAGITLNGLNLNNRFSFICNGKSLFLSRNDLLPNTYEITSQRSTTDSQYHQTQCKELGEYHQ